MLDELTPEQFAEWQGYWLLEPFGDEWRQAALTAYMVLRTMGGKGAKRLQPDDLLPVPRRIKRQQSPAQMLNTLKSFAALQRAKKGAG